MPQVSVVLPAFNHEAYIAEAIDSVLGQTLADFELIIIDDGSQDRTPDIISTFTDPRIRFVRQANAGSHATINRGVGMATGRYVAILNSDDRYTPDRLGRLLAVAEARPGPSFLVSAVRLIDAGGQPITDPQHWWLRMYADIHQQWRQHRDPLAALMWGNLTVSTSNFFFSRSLFDALGPLRHYRYVLDWEYALRAASALPDCFVYLDDAALLDYRLHGNNTILGGAIRNHLEAAHIIRSALQRRDGGAMRTPLWRLHYLQRFLRRKEVATREHQLKVQHAALTSQASQLQIMTDEKEKIRIYKDELEIRLAATADQLAEQEQARVYLEQKRTQLEQAITAAISAQHTLQQAHQATQAQLQTSESARHRQAAELAQAQHVLQAMQSSTSWRITQPLRWAGRQKIRLANGRLALRLLGQRHQGYARLIPHAVAILLRSGPTGLRAWLRSAIMAAPPPVPGQPEQATDPYQAWITAQASRVESLRAQLPERLAALPAKPVFSVVISSRDLPLAAWDETLTTVQQQCYPMLEVCLAEPLNASDEWRQWCSRHATDDPRIKTGGQTASGDFVLPLAAGDKLMPHALLAFAEYLAQHPDAAVIYSDEDKFDVHGQRQQPLFKPDWSPTLACIQNYIGHALCVRRDLFAACGAMGRNIDGANGYDLVLRLSEQARPHHLADVLYHQRLDATGHDPAASQAMHEAGKRAVAAHLARRYPQQFLRVDDGDYLFTYDPRFVARPARVSIIIPTKDKIDLLAVCLDSILQKTRWPDYEILVLDNNSTEAETFTYFERICAQDSRVRVIPAPYKFNWSFLNNFGVRHATGDVLLFLNNDTELISPDWLERLVETTSLSDVGTVGAQLYYEDGTLQHVGVVVGMGGWADHVYKGTMLANSPSPFIANALTRNVLASTGACVAIERSKFEQLGGFDEAFEICGSDVELGIRAHQRGLQNLCLAPVKLRHFESKTRGSEVPEVDFIQSDLKYAPYRLGGDPFYNPNLARYQSTPEVSSEIK